MKVKVFDKNEKGKIEFTRKELEALLNEVYNDGHSDGYEAGRNSKTYTWTSPSWTYQDTLTSPSKQPYYTTTTCATTESNIQYINSDTCESVYYGVEDIDEDQLCLKL